MKPEELGAWQALLQEEFEKPYWQTLSERVDTAYAASAVYPPREALFAAFRLTPPEAVRAVILGQDPYHEPGQANGLAFSVNPGVKLPPSLRNIFAELQSDCDITPPDSGDLTTWARQGVFLLNSSLSVEAERPQAIRISAGRRLQTRSCRDWPRCRSPSRSSSGARTHRKKP